MKLFSLLFAALVGTAVLAPVTASADPYCGPRTKVTYDRCGNATFWVYTFAGRDCHGHPIFRWVAQHRGGHGGYDRGGYDRGGYGHGGRDHGYSRGGGGRWSR